MCENNMQQSEEMIAKQKEESLRRMKILKLFVNAVKEFKNERKLNYSERAVLFWLEDDVMQKVREWEEKTGNMVYHAIKNTMEWGVCYSLLYVSPEEELWERDREDLMEGYPLVYSMNMESWGSEYGTIGVRPCLGGVLRTE